MIVVAVAALTVGAVGVTAAPQGPKTSHPKGVKVSRGATTLAVDPAFASALDAEATTEILAPAKAGTGGIDFPITQGRLLLTKNQANDITAATGSIWHVGGLLLTDKTDATKTVRLRNFRIVLDADPHMSAGVKTGDGANERSQVFDLEFDPANVSITGERKRRLTIEDIVVKLNGESATALNELFTPAVPFTDGQLVGTADVHTKIVGRR